LTVKTVSNCKICLLSFGPFGPELTNAWNGIGNAREQIANKLKRAGLNKTDIALLFSRVTLEQVDENIVSDNVHRFLATEPLLGGQPEHAAVILHHWLYGAAERRKRITYADLISKLSEVGRYLHARVGYWRDWFSVIEPLDNTAEPDLQNERLSDQFQQGMSARFEHILADCDVPRRHWLERITLGFSKENVVVIHGASGQGKSALAYRWLHDETPNHWRFQIRLIDTRRDALQIATILSSHAQAVEAPMTIFIDVRPGDNAWPELVQELARLAQIRVLVTIREEDWRRATLSGAAIAFTDIALNLEQAEARNIYQLLTQPAESARFLSFEDAWNRFIGSANNDGPLMEFVYLLTQTETLRERLKQQVDAIRDEVRVGVFNPAELRLLALVVFASSLGARLNVTEVRKMLALPDLGRSIERLEREYLVRIRDEGLLLDGLHPLRSQHLTDILCDDITFDARELALECLDLIPAEDVEIFLLHLATRHTSLMNSFVEHIYHWQSKTWAAHGAVLRALLWWGVYQYVDQLSELVEEIRSQHSHSWLVMLDLDIAGLNPPHGTAVWRGLDFFAEEKKMRLQSFLDRQPPKALALAPAHHWIKSIPSRPTSPSTEGDWAAVAELSYWAGHWSIDAPVCSWLSSIELDQTLDHLPLQMIAALLLGRWELEGELFSPWLERRRGQITERFGKETDTAWIEDQNGTVRAHFLVSWTEITGGEQAHPNEEDKQKDRLHLEAIQRVSLLRGLYPDRLGYGYQGYGHQIPLMLHDSTTKTSIKPEGLPSPWPVRLNGILTGLIEWRYRSVEWTDYILQIWSFREDMLTVMQNLRRAFVAHFRNKQKRQTVIKHLNLGDWDSLKHTIDVGIPLPRQAVDEWGFVSEGKESNKREDSSPLESGFAITPLRRFIKSQFDLFLGLGHFLGQSMPHLCLDCSHGKASIELSRSLIATKLDESGDKLISPRLVSYNLAEAISALPRFQREFRRHFGNRMPVNQLDEQDRREIRTLEAVLSLWNAYLAQPTVHWSEPERRATAIAQHPINQVFRHIENALRSLEADGIKAVILKKLGEWEDAPALWITFDSDDPLQVLGAVALAKPILRQCVSDVGLNEEQTRALERRWHHVVIAPLFEGLSYDQQVRLFPIRRLTARETSSDFEWLDDVPRPVSDEVWKRTNLRCWSNAFLEEAKMLMQTIGRFKALTDHLSGWLRLARVEDADSRVLQNYLDCYKDEWSGIVQALIDSLDGLTKKFINLSPEEQQQRTYLTGAIVKISDHHHQWLPPGLERGETVMSIDGCEAWLSMVASLIDELHSVSILMLIDSMLQAAKAKG